jgi:type IV pilus assembly protein PilX
MLPPRLTQPTPPSRQQGMTLLVGLILLLMMTVISTIGFRNTTTSERMTGNSVDRNVSFQSAENSGKEALALIEAGSFNPATLGHYATPLSQGGTSSFWTQGDGAAVSNTANCPSTSPFSWQSCSLSVTSKYANNLNRAQYAIELLTSNSSGGSTVSTYRVTSRSTGGSGNAEVILQTTYVRTTTP